MMARPFVKVLPPLLDPSLAIAFVLGLTSSAHCMFMCGGIMGALTLGAAPAARAGRLRLFAHVSAYNLGRILTYVLAGVLLGAFGRSVLAILGPIGGHAVLQLVAALVLVAAGLYLTGWLPRLARLERLGEPLWRRIQPLAARLLPVRSPGHALLYGLAWGALPCGLVYAALVWAAASGDPIGAGLRMLAFGAGTLPGLLAAGVMAGGVTRFIRRPGFRQVVGLGMITVAVGTLLLSLGTAGPLPAH